MDIINSLYNEHLIVSIILLLVCLFIKKETGKINDWKLQFDNPKLFPHVKLAADFLIDIIPIVGYHLISFIENNGTKTLICTTLMIVFIYLEAKIRNRLLSLTKPSIGKILGFVLGLALMTIALYIIIFFIASKNSKIN